MSWFQKICRNAGLMVHGIKQPIQEDAKKRGAKQVIKHEVEEEQLDNNVTLRRTTIEEIEMTPGSSPDKLKSTADKPDTDEQQTPKP